MKVGHNNKDQLFCMNTPPTLFVALLPSLAQFCSSGSIQPTNLWSGKLSHSACGKFFGGLKLILDIKGATMFVEN